MIAALLVPNPVTSPLFLAFALFRGNQAIKPIADYLRLSTEHKRKTQEMRSALRKLDRQLDTKSKAFERAVKSLKIRVHPDIHAVAKLFCDVDSVQLDPVKVDTPDIPVPDVTKYVRSPEYRKKIDPDYRPLLDSF